MVAAALLSVIGPGLLPRCRGHANMIVRIRFAPDIAGDAGAVGIDARGCGHVVGNRLFVDGAADAYRVATERVARHQTICALMWIIGLRRNRRPRPRGASFGTAKAVKLWAQISGATCTLRCRLAGIAARAVLQQDLAFAALHDARIARNGVTGWASLRGDADSVAIYQHCQRASRAIHRRVGYRLHIGAGAETCTCVDTVVNAVCVVRTALVRSSSARPSHRAAEELAVQEPKNRTASPGSLRSGWTSLRRHRANVIVLRRAFARERIARLNVEYRRGRHARLRRRRYVDHDPA